MLPFDAAYKLIVSGLLLIMAGVVASFFVGLAIRHQWPAQIPPDLRFERELSSALKLCRIAELLVERFSDFNNDDVVCLGLVRSNAARVLFHAGPKNTGHNRNLHRPDYVLHVERLSQGRVKLRLGTNKPYSYLRIRRAEVDALKRTLHDAFDAVDL
ncbi:MAG: hypothetical protein JRH20_29900 [Deltaproteobacteria bacterium]|nr:hypothetical protein [Deltaproteobacteria bacterium]